MDLLFETLLDVWHEMALGYSGGSDEIAYPIRIRQICYLRNSWLITCSGTDFRVNQATGIPEDIAAGTRFFETYSIRLLDAVRKRVPLNGRLYLYGHSSGGMAIQNALEDLISASYKIASTITCGAPLTNILGEVVPVKRFWADGDIVPSSTPGSWVKEMKLERFYIKYRDPEITPGVVASHLSYYKTQYAAGYDVLGKSNVTGQRPFTYFFVSTPYLWPVPKFP